MIGAILVVFLAIQPKDLSNTSGGVVVEETEAGSAADKAGMRPDDVIQFWRRATTPSQHSVVSGTIKTPFDLREAEIQNSPPGTLTLHGTRNSRPVQLDIKPMPWGVRVRPSLNAKDLTTFKDGQRLISEKNLESGAATWRALAAEWTGEGRELDSAWLLSRVGSAYFDAKKPDNGESTFRAAILQAEHARQRSAASQLWSELGDLLWGVPDRTKAREAYQQALRIRETSGREDLAVGEALNTLNRHSNVLDPAARSRAQRSLSIFEKWAPQSYGAASALNFLGVAAMRMGDFRGESRYHRRALAVVDSLDPDSLEVAKIVSNMGVAAADAGDFATADDLDRRALAIREKLTPDGEPVAASLINLGLLESMRGEPDIAETCYRRALVLFEKDEPGGYGSAVALQNLGNIELDRRAFAEAEAFFRQSLLLYKKYSSGRDVALIQLNLGLIAQNRGDLRDAERLYQDALGTLDSIAPESVEYSDALTYLGNLELARGDRVASESYHVRALRLRETACPASAKEAASLHSLGFLALSQGQNVKATDLLRRALDALEAQKRRLGGSENAGATFSANYADFYNDYIDVLIRQDQPVPAFHVYERSRAASLLSMLAERDLVFSADVSEDIERERKAVDAEYDRTQADLLEQNPKDNGAEVEKLRGRLIELRAKQQGISEVVKKASPHYASLRYPQPLDLNGTRSVLDEKTLLLAYSLGSRSAFLFLVEPSQSGGSGLTVIPLKGNDSSFREAINAYRNLLEMPAPAAEALAARSRSLYEALIKPAEPLIARYDRLLILADGPLQTIPFAGLVRDVRMGRPEYLVEWKPIVNVVSATVYAELKRARKESPRDASIVVAAFGDPKYSTFPKKMLAVKRGANLNRDASVTPIGDFEGVEDPQLRSVARGGFSFEPLPASRKEVADIASLYAPKSAAYLGADATEERAKSVGRDVPIIHFACHAVINESFPLDSALLFTIPEKPREGQDNGLLQAWEIFEQVRLDADLVTLSACESGLGKEMGGEGLVGLTRAFQYAGARSVLASLWRVDDKATAELMKRFYVYLKAGHTKDQALRLAQIDLIRSADYSEPRDWAGFQLNGDWK